MSRCLLAPAGETGIVGGWLQVYSPDLSEGLRTDTGALEAYDSGNLALYKITAVESATIPSVYVGVLPGNFDQRDAYPWAFYDGVNAMPRAMGVMPFDGANEITLASTLDASVAALASGGASAIATAVWQDQLSGVDFAQSGSAGQLIAAFATLLALGTADVKIDQTQNPWQRVFLAKGTSTVLLRQNLLDIFGEPVTSIEQVIASMFGV